MLGLKELSDRRNPIPGEMDVLQTTARGQCHSQQYIEAIQRPKDAPSWKWEWQGFCIKSFLRWSPEDDVIQDHGLNVSVSGTRLWWVEHQRSQPHEP